MTRLRHLLKKYSEEKLNLEEQIELSEQLSDPQNQDTKQIIHEDWKAQLETEGSSDWNLKPILDQVHHQIRLIENSSPSRLIWWQNFQRIAAILIFPLLLSFLAYLYINKTNQNNQPVSYAEIQCPFGARTKFHLPDGSTGFLNSGSSLKYPVQFIGERKVELIGEAFFDVVHNKEIPFHVNTKNMDIKVLGTTFDVIANEDEETEEIVLEKGKVDVLLKNGKPLTALVPNEQLVLNIEKQEFTKNIVEADQYSTWKEGKLVFRNENTEQMARRLSRWYNVDMVISDQLLDGYTFHATFINEPLDEVLKLLSLTTPICYSEEKRSADSDGIYKKRKITVQTNKFKISHFK